MAQKPEKWRELSEAELRLREKELMEQRFRLKFQMAAGQAESTTKLRNLRRDLARVKTVLRERELEKSHDRG
ncbi:MAG TPA: 50S ribosomal protein L29 [Candidatus Acidoferrales bacterium]|uniref:Large ribosomal subunit protein uL29 n=1 Tax=uncultured Acidobacteria bacterium Rifle_16ft_4_minimus_37967 TaxID=1665087 RepID=A0A0H4T6J6_9BACT|nr:50S ribosomal protein L29P, large subunit ribosomal protein L29 [uncultured Acidobacteria bacterium Rifle_16ft_4_minimus_37967]